MFEILGYLKEKEERFLKHIDKNIEGFFDFSRGNYKQTTNSFVLLPPYKEAILDYSKNNTVVVTMENPSLPSLFSLNEYENVLSLLKDFKNIYIELNLYCTDFDFETRNKNIVSVNQGILNSYVRSSKIFKDEISGVPYYTYKGHLVFIHDPLSVSLRHNLVKKMGFKGIFIRDVKLAADGNWESLIGMKKSSEVADKVRNEVCPSDK